jgi:tetratricopeptide (TPR) repeat protein
MVLIAGGLFQPHAAGGLPLQFLLSNQWRNLFANHSPLTNPALMTDEQYPSLRGVFSFSPEQVAQLWEAGYIQPLGLYQSLGFTWVQEKGEPVSNGVFDPSSMAFTSTEETTNDNTCLMLSYANNPWRQLSLGLNVKFLNQTNFGSPSSGLAADVGLSYRLLRHPILGYHVLGIMCNTILSAGLDSLQLEKGSQLQATYHSTYLQNQINLDAQFDLTDILTQSDAFVNGNPVFGWNLLLQSGAWVLHIFDLQGYLGLNADGIDYWGIGVGFNIPSVNAGRDASILYQFRDLLAENVMASHSLYVRVDVGKHREEIYARKLAKEFNLSPNELYNRAMKLYSAGKYWDAYIVFAQLNTEFPDFFKNDLVMYYMGSCLEELDMRNVAIRAYNETIATYSSSEAVPLAELGLMRIFYRQDKIDGVAREYNRIRAMADAPDSVRDHANYLMGETNLQHQLYSEALQLFGQIPDNSHDYAYAQHSMAVAHLILGDSPTTAMSYLASSLDAEPATKADQELADRSYLFVGYLYYEQDSLSKAVSALRKIPQTSVYYPEALLGLGWTAIKAHQWVDCVLSGQNLASADAEPMLQAEGLLIAGYGFIQQKQYEKAAVVLGSAQKKLETYKPLTADSLSNRKREYEGNRTLYDSLGINFTDRACKSGTVSMAGELEKLHDPQLDLKDKVDGYARFIDRYNRAALFGKNLTTLTKDIEYAKVTVDHTLGESKSTKTLQRDIETRQQLDQEIQKAKEQLGKIKDGHNGASQQKNQDSNSTNDSIPSGSGDQEKKRSQDE